MKVLVLGATGNVGSRIVPALLAHKHNVVIYVRSEGKVKKMFPPSILSQITIVKGNATEAASIEKALVDQTCDALVNSAGLASVFPWQAPHMQEIINAVARAGVEASCKLKKPIRAWFLGGMTALDVPGMKGTMLMKYLPIFTEHALTYACLSAKSQKNLAWSMLCPSYMVPINETIAVPDGSRRNPLVASVDVPPGWQDSYFKSVPFLGQFLSILGNAFRYNTKLEDCADFIAKDLEKQDSEFRGHRVGVFEPDNGKLE